MGGVELDDPTRFGPGEKQGLIESLAFIAAALQDIGRRLDRAEGVLHLRETAGEMASSIKEKPSESSPADREDPEVGIEGVVEG